MNYYEKMVLKDPIEYDRIEKPNFKIKVPKPTKLEQMTPILLLCLIITPIYLQAIAYQGDKIMCTCIVALIMFLIWGLLWIIWVTIFGEPSKELLFHQAVYVTGGFNKGRVGYIIDKLNFHPDTWTCHSGYELRIHGEINRVDLNCLRCYWGCVMTQYLTPCLCQNCESPLFTVGFGDNFYCKKCKGKVEIINKSDYEEE